MSDIETLVDTPATIAGINIGGTTTTVIGGTADGKIFTRWTRPTEKFDGEALIRETVSAVRAVAPDATALGVAVGGPFDRTRGIVTSAPHLPGLWNLPLRDRLTEELGIPVSIHHDAAACALAEYRWGPNAGVDGLVYLTCGTGFGAGLVFGGRARYGTFGHSPEIGHVRFRPDGPAIFDKPGCYEGYGSANALHLIASWLDPVRFPPELTSSPGVVEAARAGDDVALAALAANHDAVGSACALLADLLVPDVIVLGTLALYLGAPWIAAVQAAFEREALPDHARVCELRAPMPFVQDLSALAAAFD